MKIAPQIPDFCPACDATDLPFKLIERGSVQEFRGDTFEVSSPAYGCCHCGFGVLGAGHLDSLRAATHDAYRRCNSLITKFTRTSARDNVESRPESRPQAGVESAMARQILTLISPQPQSKSELARNLGKNKPTRYMNELVARPLRSGLIEYTFPDKPNSRLQKYRLTNNRHAALQGSLPPG